MAGLVVAALLAVPLLAALSPEYREWREGPAQWVFTPAEQKEWKAIETDEGASRFIDLFWARRDPTPGHPLNEYRDEFNLRVQYADENFGEPRRRGAMTDRGRAWILLGPPTAMGGEGDRDARLAGGDGLGGRTTGTSPLAGRTMGARYIWEWSHEDSIKRFDMPRVAVFFVGDPSTRRVQRDSQRGDFSGAAAGAMKKMIVTPLTAVPPWALHGGLNPKVPEALTRPRPVVEHPATIAEEQATSEAGGAASATGISRLVLLNDPNVISPATSGDPFAGVAPVRTFGTGTNVGWVAEFCSNKPEAPKLQLIVRLRGDGGTDNVTRSREISPDPVRSKPGCYLLRGAMPLKNIAAGRYELGVLIDDLAAKKTFDRYQPFDVH